MADNTKIEWTDATWNPITGCSIVSPGCTNCYAMKLAGTRLKNHPSREGLTTDTKAGPVWNGEVRFNEQWIDQPLQWKRPRMIFVCAHGDLFAEGVPDLWIDRVFAVMALAPHHTFQVLTKRPERMRAYVTDAATYQRILRAADAPRQANPKLGDIPISDTRNGGWWPHVWLGASVEDQRRADERRTPMFGVARAGWMTWISYEPALGLVDWMQWSFLEWLVSGGESGPSARPSHPDWHRQARDACATFGIPFLFKQWGEWTPQVGAVDGWTINDDPEISRIDHRDWEGDHFGEAYRPMWCDDVEDDTVSRIGKKSAGRRLDGIEHNAFPPKLPASVILAALDAKAKGGAE